VNPRDEPAGVEAARRVLVEVWTVLSEHRDSLTLVGGSAPPFVVHEAAAASYVGTLDVDVVVDPVDIPVDAYRSIAEQLETHGYYNVPKQQPFRWYREVDVDGQVITVGLDLLAPETDSTGPSHRHEMIEGTKLARRTAGAELVRGSSQAHHVAGRLPDGRSNTVTVNVACPGTLVVLKALALGGRDKPKDAYDIDFLLAHVPGGVEQVAREIAGFGNVAPVPEALSSLEEKYASEDSYGPQSVAVYRRLVLGTDEAYEAQALAYARVKTLLERISAGSSPR